MRRWLRGLTALAVPVLLVAGALTAGPARASTGTLDQEQPVANTQLWGGMFENTPVAQVFTADRTGLMDQVDVYSTPQDWYGPLDVTVTGVTTLSASWGTFQIPSGPALGFGQIYTNQNWPLWWSIPLSQPAPVVAGQTYALEFSFPPATATTYWGGYDMFDGTSGPAPGYPVGIRFAGVWYQQNGSMAFRTYVEPTQPVLTVPTSPITVPATSSAGAVVTYTASAVDSAGNPLTPSCSPPSGSTFPVGTTSVTCTVTDSSGNTATKSFDVTVQDTDLALSGMPSDITVDASGPSGATVSFTPPTAVDEDSPSGAAVSCLPASGSVFPIGTTTVTCSATDSDDTPSSVSQSFNVTVLDTDLALSGMPSDITVNASSPSGATVSFTPPSAVDEDSPSAAAVSCLPAPGSVFAVGTTTVSCTATDPDDTPSSVSQSFNLTVLGPAAQLTQLGQAVQGVGSGNSLAAKVEQAQAQLAAGNTAGACATLTAFENEVQAQSGKKLSTAQADQLLAAAQQIQAASGC